MCTAQTPGGWAHWQEEERSLEKLPLVLRPEAELRQHFSKSKLIDQVQCKSMRGTGYFGCCHVVSRLLLSGMGLELLNTENIV